MPNPEDHNVWKHFKKCPGGKQAICNYCKTPYSKNVTRLRIHLSKCKNMPDHLKDILQQRKKKAFTSSLNCHVNMLSSSKSPEQVLPLDSEHSSAKTSVVCTSSLSVDQPRPVSSSKSIKSFMDNVSPKEKDVLDTMFARAVYCSGSPLSITENKYWRQFFSRIRPNYEIPSRHRLSNSLLDRKYAIIQQKIIDKISAASSLTLMSDGWSDITGKPLINIVFATPEPVFLKVIESNAERHTGEYIAQILELEINNVGADKVIALVSDNARNMHSAWNILKEKFPSLLTFGCLAHGLHLLTKDILQIPTISRIVANCKEIVIFFKNHHIPNQVLKNIQCERGSTGTALQLPSATRWGSTNDCMKSIIKNKEYLQTAAVRDEVSTMMSANLRKMLLDNDIFWVRVESISSIIQPVCTAIKRLESDTPRLSEVVEIFSSLYDHFTSSLTSSPLLNTEEQTLIKVFKERRKFCSHPIHFCANLLDPKYMGHLLSQEQYIEALDMIHRIAQGIANVDTDAVLNDLAQYRAKHGMWSHLVIWEVAKKSDAVTWWTGICGQHPLSEVAKRILNIPATAAACERYWKSCSLVKTKKRNRLTTHRMAKLVSVSQNLKILDNNLINNFSVPTPHQLSSSPIASTSRAIILEHESDEVEVEEEDMTSRSTTSQSSNNESEFESSDEMVV